MLSRLEAGLQQLPPPSMVQVSADPNKGKSLCKPHLSVSCSLFLLLFKHTIFCFKLQEIVVVEIPINLGSKCCNYREVYILHEMRMNLKRYWNLLKLDRDQEIDSSIDTTQLFKLEIQGRM
jgi:hypothetical protein